nr:immunoglobulin heavy chain junction region [Mus musculus]
CARGDYGNYDAMDYW